MRRLALALAFTCASVGGPPAPAGRGGAGAPPDSRDAALERAMKTKRLSHLKFENAKVDDVVKYLRIATGWNYVVKRLVIQKANIDLDALTVTVQLDDVTIATFLEIVLDGHGLVAKVEGNIIFVTTKADAQGKPVVVLHPISHLTWKKTDFIAPTLDLYPSDYTPPEEYVPEVVVEDDPLADTSKIVDLVKELVEAPWDTEGWSITATAQFLLVKAPRAVQSRVTAALETLAAMK